MSVMGRTLVVVWGLALLGAGACGDDAPGVGDAAAGDAGVDAGNPLEGDPEAPRIDWLEDGQPPIAAPADPMLTPCPPGWREVAPAGASGIATCDPWPTSGRASCAAHEAHFAGDAGCARVGTECAPDGWPAGLPSGAIHVREGARGGDGSRGSPLGSIAVALAGATPGTTVGLARGTYAEVVTLPAGVTLIGACAEGTTIAPGASTTAATITAGGAGAVVRNLTVAARRVGVHVTAAVELEDVVVDGARGAGVRVEGGALTASGVVVRGTRADASGNGDGLHLDGGGSVQLERGVLSDNQHAGVGVADAGARASLSDVVVADTNADARGGGGRGVTVTRGARAELVRAVLEGNRAHAVYAADAGSEVVLTDAVIRDTLVRESDGADGQAVLLRAGATGSATRLAIERVADAGVDVRQSTFTAEDLYVVDTENRGALPQTGQGVTVAGPDASATLTRVRVERAHFAGLQAVDATLSIADAVVRDVREAAPFAGRGLGNGVLVFDAMADATRVHVSGTVRAGISLEQGASLTLADAVVRDVTNSVNDGNGGETLNVDQSSMLEADRVLLERGLFAGLGLTNGSVARVRDVLVREMDSPAAFGISGHAAVVWTGSQLSVERGLFERNRMAAVLIESEGSLFEGTDVVIREMFGDSTFGLHGWAIGASEGGRAHVTRLLVERARYVGIVVNGRDSTIDGVDVVIRSTLEAECAEPTAEGGPALCADAPFGVGIGAYGGGAADFSRFEVAGSDLINVQLASDGTVDLRNGEVSGSPFGVNIQTPDFDLERLTEDVAYVDNGVNLETAELPVPGLGF